VLPKLETAEAEIKISDLIRGSARLTGGAPGLQTRIARWEALERRMVDTSVAHRVTGFTPLSLETYSKTCLLLLAVQKIFAEYKILSDTEMPAALGFLVPKRGFVQRP
jgi:hypothetical protein